MDEKDYVSFETALALKNAGFDYECEDIYHISHCADKHIELWNNRCLMDWNNTTKTTTQISAPTLWQAQKWFREVKNIDVLVYSATFGYGWEISRAGDGTTDKTMLLTYNEDKEDDEEYSGNWMFYEDALHDGIKKALKLINK